MHRRQFLAATAACGLAAAIPAATAATWPGKPVPMKFVGDRWVEASKKIIAVPALHLKDRRWDVWMQVFGQGQDISLFPCERVKTEACKTFDRFKNIKPVNYDDIWLIEAKPETQEFTASPTIAVRTNFFWKRELVRKDRLGIASVDGSHFASSRSKDTEYREAGLQEICQQMCKQLRPVEHKWATQEIRDMLKSLYYEDSRYTGKVSLIVHHNLCTDKSWCYFYVENTGICLFS